MPDDAFTETRVPCTDERKIADALWKISSQQLDKAGNPKMVDYGVDKISLRDGRGQIAAIEYTFEPGNPGVISKAVDFYLITENCRVQYWEHTGP